MGREDFVTDNRRTRAQEGFALILAILSLMLLTFLGLAMLTSTSTELQIATNYRWTQQAYYNAEAGVEVGKTLLGKINNWNNILWPARTAPWNTAPTPGGSPVPTTITIASVPIYVSNPPTPAGQDAYHNNLRHFEGGPCDHLGNGAGYGVVFNDGTTVFQNMTSLRGKELTGAVTMWVRRPLVAGDGTASDDSDNGNIILTVEGSAPFMYYNQTDSPSNDDSTKSSQNTLGLSNRAYSLLEFSLSRQLTATEQCGGRGGQSGKGQEGSGFSGCTAVTEASVGSAVGRNVHDTGAQ